MGRTIILALYYLLLIFEVVLFVRVFATWIPRLQESKWMNILYQLTEPVLMPVRRMLDRYMNRGSMMFDFSPIIVFILLQIVRSFLYKLIILG